MTISRDSFIEEARGARFVSGEWLTHVAPAKRGVATEVSTATIEKITQGVTRGGITYSKLQQIMKVCSCPPPPPSAPFVEGYAPFVQAGKQGDLYRLYRDVNGHAVTTWFLNGKKLDTPAESLRDYLTTSSWASHFGPKAKVTHCPTCGLERKLQTLTFTVKAEGLRRFGNAVA